MKLLFKLFIFFIIISGTVNFSLRAHGIDKDDTREECYALKNSSFRKVPSELVRYIAHFLHGSDFISFVRACKPFKNIVMNYKPFSIPEDENQIINIISVTPLIDIPTLIKGWERSPQKVIPMLRKILTQFESLEAIYLEQDYKLSQKKFKTYIKLLNLLYGIGDKRALATFTDAYHQTQVKLHETLDEDDAVLPQNAQAYISYYKNFSLLNNEVRKNISEKYIKGISPFKLDNKKGDKYSKELGLPLSSDLL